MTKTKIAGHALTWIGMAVWLWGYFTAGTPALVDWHTRTPEWIAEWMPNLQSEVGMALLFAAMVPMYWPSRPMTWRRLVSYFARERDAAR